MASIDVIITTYFRNDQLRNAIESVRGQDGVDLTLYVIDMSECEHAKPVADEFGLNYVPIESYDVENPIEQVAIARDVGANVSDGEYVYFLDDDNVVRDGGLRTLLETFEQECGVACCVMDGLLTEQQVYPFFAAENPVDSDAVLEFTLMNLVCPFSISGMLLKREALEAIPPMRELPHDDIAVVIELAKVTSFSTVGKVLVEMQDDHGLSLAEESMEGRAALFDHYEDEYDSFPEFVKKCARSRKHYLKASVELQNHYWSPRMIYHYFRYAYHYPEREPVQYLTALASLFGKHGVNAVWSRMQTRRQMGEPANG